MGEKQLKNYSILKIQKRLFELQDISYRDFHSKLMPTIEKEKVIGVRVPVLRDFAKELFKNGNYKEFMMDLPHKYYEENNLHAFLIEQIRDFDDCIKETEKFLPYIDNWATCDMLRPKVFKKYLTELLGRIKVWVKKDECYTVRFGIEMLMCYFLDDYFEEEYPELVSHISSDEYYINMMISWYFATALSKKYDKILPYIKDKKLPRWVHNKAIQKAIESRRISKEQKNYLKTLKY